MAHSRVFGIVVDSFLDGITGAGLFGKLRRPGAPTILADAQSPDQALDDLIKEAGFNGGLSRKGPGHSLPSGKSVGAEALTEKRRA
jgi:hypothetical protein